MCDTLCPHQVLEQGRCRHAPILTFNGTTAVDVLAGEDVTLGGWQPFTLAAWVKPEVVQYAANSATVLVQSHTPRPPPPTLHQAGGLAQVAAVRSSTIADGMEVSRTIFSKMDRDVKGEFEFGLTSDNHLIAHRLTVVTFTLPQFLRVGEDFILLYKVRGNRPPAGPLPP